MRNHNAPRGIRKDRDYILFEKDHFLFSMGVTMRTLAQSLPSDTALDVRAMTMEIGEALEGYDIAKVTSTDFHDRVRKLAWKYLRHAEQERTAFLLMFVDAIDGSFIAESKIPDDITKKRRSTKK